MYRKTERFSDMELRNLRDPLNSREAAGVLGKSLHWLQTATRNGDVPAVKVGHTWSYSKHAIFALAGIETGGGLDD